MELNYRKGIPSDKEKLQALGLNAYGQYEKTLDKLHWDKMQSFLNSEEVYDELLVKSTCFVCEAANEIVGMAYLMPNGNPTDIFEPGWSYIRMVGVDVNFAGRGIGKALTQMCIDFAKSTHEKCIALHTSEFMDAARHLYESLGFKQVKEIDNRYGKRYWLYQIEF
jgi:ribosomal protein S18 acetylase RimI-like enzyme